MSAMSSTGPLPRSYWQFDLAQLRRNASRFAESFPGAEICYALKANGHPSVIAAIDPVVQGYEAASWGEIHHLLGLGVSTDRIVFGTAVKAAHQVVQAVAAGVRRFASDSSEDLLMLSQCAPGCSVQIRVRVDDSGSVFQLSSKFGAELDDVTELAMLAMELGLDVYGLSFNVGSQTTGADAHAAAVRAIIPTLTHLQRLGCPIRTLNIGGGFPVQYAPINGGEVETIEEIASAVAQAAAELPPTVQLMLEPGRALVAVGIDLVTTVVASVSRRDAAWLFCDAGVYNALMEAMPGQGSTRYPVEILDPVLSQELGVYTLAGPTGDSIDVIMRDVELPKGIGPGTRIRFRHTGGYTMSMSSEFNGFELPPVLVREEVDRSNQPITDTVATRLAIGFPAEAQDWCAAPAIFDDHTLRILGHPVMEDWETEYMTQLASVATRHGGDILELGYGMGISARVIQAASIASHHVVECHPDVVSSALRTWREAIAAQRLHLHVGFWEEVSPRFADASFDGILFDTYPLKSEEIHGNHFPFLKEAYRLLRPGGTLTYYSDQATELPEEHLSALEAAGFERSGVSWEVCPVSPPADCEYWQSDSLVVPVVRKPR